MTHIATTGRDGISVLTIDRPPVNAMNLELLQELVAELRQISSAPPAALTIAGRPGCFSAGLDLKTAPQYTASEHREVAVAINQMVLLAYGLPCPVVSAITGHAIAGGLVLALCGDYRIASSAGRYGLTEVKVGVPYPAAAIGVVRSELEPRAARTLALGSRLTGAGECVAAGAFDEALAPERVLDRALETSQELAALPTEAYAQAKGALRAPALDAMRAAVEADPLLRG